jgi:putative membrane protein
MRLTMKTIFAVSLAAALALSLSAAQAQSADKDSQKFIKSAIQGNLAEIDMGKLAQEKGKSAAVKSYGEMLVTDHGAANEKAKQAADKLGVTPPSGPSVAQKAGYLKMKVMSGDTFDRSFAKDMVKDHQKDIKEYEKASQKNDAAGAYAKEGLPTLRKHLEAAQKLSPEKKTSSR